MAQLEIGKVKAFITELGFSIPDSVLELLIESVNERADCLSRYGDNKAALMMLYSVARMASMSGARKISSQSAPSGAGRSFTYDSSGTNYLLYQIKAWDTEGCLNDLALDGNQVGFFAVVGSS